LLSSPEFPGLKKKVLPSICIFNCSEEFVLIGVPISTPETEAVLVPVPVMVMAPE
jgi:hypothetical protein